jgi:superfamily II DNA/RNA helicase/cold shock CspA family protein
VSFTSLGVSSDARARLERRGITEPFPIQAATVPDALAGLDVCGKAPTGSGKTLAFGLAIAARVGGARPGRPQALVLVPTRELAAQVQRELALLLRKDQGAVVGVYGGVGYEPQRRALRKGASVVVACPGRLEDLVANGDVHLGEVQVVVVDEADRMADMGFLPAVRRLLDRTPASRQTLLFSATLDREVDALVTRYQRSPRRHEVNGDERDGAEVQHLFRPTERPERVRTTAALIAEHGQSIVFCRTRRGAERLTRQLGAAGVDAVAIHGDRSQGQRERALAAFTAGRAQALVATDVAARGIHVDDVACVVHFDPPADAKDYVHRSGRTGRAGASGVVVSLVSEEQEQAVGQLRRELGLLDRGPRRRQKVGPSRGTGTVKFFHGKRGYGFIARENGGDVFVHHTNISGRELRPGQRVQFDVSTSDKGDEALNVLAV